MVSGPSHPFGPSKRKEEPVQTETDGPAEAPPLHLVWLLDRSSSMVEAGKLFAARLAVNEFVAGMRQDAATGVAPPYAGPILVSVLGVSAGVRWLCESMPLEHFDWNDSWSAGPPLSASDLGAAFREVADRLAAAPMPQRAPAAVVVLMSDGQPTDDWRGGLHALDATARGRSAVRLAVRIGDDAQDQVMRAFSPRRDPCENRDARYEVAAALYDAAHPQQETDPDAAYHPSPEDEFDLDDFATDYDEETSIAW